MLPSILMASGVYFFQLLGGKRTMGKHLRINSKNAVITVWAAFLAKAACTFRDQGVGVTAEGEKT
jgi:hypothetical protein